MKKNEAVYRKVALERLSSPDQLDMLMQIIAPRGWLTLLGLGLLLVAGLVWSIVGKVPIELAGEGVLIRRGGVATLASRIDGQVEAVHVRIGDVVEQGASLATLRPFAAAQGTAPEGRAPAAEDRLVAPFRCRVLELMMSRGDSVAVGVPLVTVEPADEELIGVFFLPESAVAKVRTGLPVRIVPRSGNDLEKGALSGRVERVVLAPATERTMRRLIADDALAGRLARTGSATRIEVRLSSPPPPTAGSGMHTVGRVRVGETRPIGLVLPWIREWLAA